MRERAGVRDRRAIVLTRGRSARVCVSRPLSATLDLSGTAPTRPRIGRNRCTAATSRLRQRRGRDSNPRTTLRPSTVFKTVARSSEAWRIAGLLRLGRPGERSCCDRHWLCGFRDASSRARVTKGLGDPQRGLGDPQRPGLGDPQRGLGDPQRATRLGSGRQLARRSRPAVRRWSASLRAWRSTRFQSRSTAGRFLVFAASSSSP